MERWKTIRYAIEDRKRTVNLILILLAASLPTMTVTLVILLTRR